MRAHYDESRACWVNTLGIGDVFATKDDQILTTLLGSCISACSYDREIGCGGMNHFLLPEFESLSHPRFGAHAMELLINRLLSLGARRRHLQFKVFGGANLLPGLADIGPKNCRFIQDYLHQEGLALEASDLGGNQARRLEFHPRSGRVRVKRVEMPPHQGLVHREVDFHRGHPHKPGEVEFFDRT